MQFIINNTEVETIIKAIMRAIADPISKQKAEEAYRECLQEYIEREQQAIYTKFFNNLFEKPSVEIPYFCISHKHYSAEEVYDTMLEYYAWEENIL